MRPAASAQNMNASSASGLWARWMARGVSAPTRVPPTTGCRGRLPMEAVEVLGVVGVLRPLTRALGGLVHQEFAIGGECPRRIVPQLQCSRPQHEGEEMRGRGAPDRIGLGARRRGTARPPPPHPAVGARGYLARPPPRPPPPPPPPSYLPPLRP